MDIKYIFYHKTDYDTNDASIDFVTLSSHSENQGESTPGVESVIRYVTFSLVAHQSQDSSMSLIPHLFLVKGLFHVTNYLPLKGNNYVHLPLWLTNDSLTGFPF